LDLLPVVLFADRRRRVILFLVLALTITLGIGLRDLRVETGVLDWLPKSNPNVEAFSRLFRDLDGAVNQELIWIELDDEKTRASGVNRVTDHTALLAQEELVEYVRARVDRMRGHFGVLSFLQSAAAKLPGRPGAAKNDGEPARLPRSEGATRLLWGSIRVVAKDYVTAFVSEDGRGTILSVIYDAPPLSTEARAVGRELAQALRDYTGSNDREHDLFRDDLLVPCGLASGTSAIDDSLSDGLRLWAPIAAATLAILLVVLLGSLRSAATVLAVLAVGAIWTLGAMGWFGATLNVVTIALVPLVLGCGIDYAILIAVESSDARDTRTASPDDTRATILERVGRSSVSAVFLTAVTTSAGLLLLVFSDSPGMVELGLYASIGMLGLAALAILILPSSVLRTRSSAGSRLGSLLVTWAGGVSRRRVLVAACAITALAIGAALAGRPVVLLDTIDGHYPPEARIAQVTHRMRAQCGGAFPEIVIVEGDLTKPGALDKIRTLERRLRDVEKPLGDFRTVSVVDVLRLTAPMSLLRGGAALDSPEEVRAAIDKLYDDPVLSPFGSMFVSRDAQVSTMLLLGADPGNDPTVVEKLWRQLDETLARENFAEAGLDVSFLGYRTMAYLFSSYSLEWIGRIGVVSLLAVLAMTALFLRSLRAVALVGVLVLLSSVTWYLLVNASGIYVSVFLLFPLVFVVCIGSDYGLHLLFRFRLEGRGGDSTHRVWRTTGRAIVLAAVTDAIAFLLFSPMELVSVSQVMIAVALAVAAVFVTTLVVVPILTRRDADPPSSNSAETGEST